MKTITLHCHSKNSGGNYSESIRIDGVSKEVIQERKNEIFEAAEKSLGNFYYTVESYDELTLQEEELLSDLDLEIDF